MHTLDEVGREADTVRSEIEQLTVRGLASSTPAERKNLSALAGEWERLGAGHVASRLLAAVQKADADAKDAPRALLSAYTSLHVFERVLSLEAAAEAWTAHIAALRADEGDDGEGDSGEADSGEEGAGASGLSGAGTGPGDKAAGKAPNNPSAPTQAPPLEDPKGTLALVEELARAVEDLVRTGLTSATESTRAKLDASFKEASRRKLLRLGASLRYVNEEVGRFLADDGSFSIRRFSFFLHRSWMLARGLAKGIRDNDQRVLASLLLSAAAPPKPVAALEVVTLGVLKRTVSNMCSFDFRLRVVSAKDPDLAGKSLVYSLVFARKKDVPAEAYLQLPQPQKFAPKVFQQGKTIKITDCAVMLDDRGGRLILGPKSTVTEGASFSDWKDLYRFDPEAALGRVQNARVGPLDLAVEMQEEVFVTGAALGDEPVRTSEGRRIYPLTGEGGLHLDAVIPDGADGEDLLPRLRAGLKSNRGPLLYGLAYYEFGRTVFLPLSIMKIGSPTKEAPPDPKAPPQKKKSPAKPSGADTKSEGPAPDLLTLSQKKFDLQSLVGTLGL